MYETWEWWQWILPVVGLLIAWAMVIGGWIVYSASERGGETSCLGVAGLAVGGIGGLWACQLTASLMRHMPQRWVSYLLTAVLVALAVVVWLQLAGRFSVAYGTLVGPWAPAAVLGGGALVALAIDGSARWLAGIPAPLIAVVGLGLLGVVMLNSNSRR